MARRFKNIFKFSKYLKVWHWPKKYLAVLLIAILIIGWFGYQTLTKKPEPIQIEQVKKQDIRQSIQASGTLTGKDTANLKFVSAGKLAYKNVKEGNLVSTGQLIATLDTQQLAINLQQAQNNLRSTQAAVDKTVDDTHLFQYGNGGFGNVGSPNETMTQRKDRTASEVLRDNAVDSLKAAQRAFQDATLTSPINGIVTQSSPLAGQTVSAADTIAQIVDESEIFFDAEVDEADIGKIKLGQLSEVSLNSYPDQTFKGTVEKITPTTKTTSSGATVVIVRVNLGKPNVNFVSGLNGQATIILKEAKNVLTIPQEALRDGNTVLVNVDNRYETKPVKTGLSSDTDVEITEGLKEGEQVVKNPQALRQTQRTPNFFGRFLRGVGVRRV